MDYWYATEVEPVIKQYKKYHPDLASAKIAPIFKEKATKSNGEPIVGKVSTITSKYEPLLDNDYDFMMTIGADVWSELSTKQREGWIDHLLAQCVGEEEESTGEMKWKTRRPEIVAFSDVVERHGSAWNHNLDKLKDVDILGEEGDSEPSSASGTREEVMEESDDDREEEEETDVKKEEPREDVQNVSDDDDLLSDIV